MKTEFLMNGFTSLSALIDKEEVETLRKIYDELLGDRELTKGLRSDLSGAPDARDTVERITQVMRPSLVMPELQQHSAYKKALGIVQDFLGDDMQLDFDMMINKAPYTNTETPWHQDAAYWIHMPDRRAVSCWIALDAVYAENGCMWFAPKTDNDHVVPHRALSGGGALFCPPPPATERVCIPLEPGGCTFHDGFTLHYSQGNTTSSQRRALILNFRPAAMIALEREQGVDHTGDRKVRQ